MPCGRSKAVELHRASDRFSAARPGRVQRSYDASSEDVVTRAVAKDGYAEAGFYAGNLFRGYGGALLVRTAKFDGSKMIHATDRRVQATGSCDIGSGDDFQAP